ncbi:hypothetical protein [Clostridioides difficile]
MVCKVVAVDLFALACVDIILTMWYVKFILLVIPPSIPLVLY